MKKYIIVIGASCLLAGCGSQNLAPLEDKTTKLRDDNHQLKLDIQQLNQDISDQKSKIAGLQKDKENSKQTATNKKKEKNLNASSSYYNKVAKSIEKYNDIDADVTKNKGSNSIQKKLSTITSDLNDAYSTYKSDIDEDSMTSEDKSTKKSINKINKNITSAFSDIEQGYQEKNKKKINKGQNKLASVQSEVN